MNKKEAEEDSNTSVKSTVDRRSMIINLLNEKGRVKVKELSNRFGVSTVTIRNDLDYFENEGLITRTYGGAILREHVARDYPLEEKKKWKSEEKHRIGKAASELIEDNDTIFINPGTTTRQVTNNIKQIQNLTVMTNAINIAIELAGRSNITVMLTGGTLREQTYSLIGPEAVATIQNYYFDKVVLSVDGLDLDAGLTSSHPMEAQLNRLMVQRSHEVIVVADSTKFGKHSFSLITGLENINSIVTDNELPEEYVEAMQEENIHLVMV